jgi:hypothetical protein
VRSAGTPVATRKATPVTPSLQVAAKIAVPTDGNQPKEKQRLNIALDMSDNAVFALCIAAECQN